MQSKFFALMASCTEDLAAVEREFDYQSGAFEHLPWKIRDLCARAHLGDLTELYLRPNVQEDGTVNGQTLVISRPARSDLDVINALHAKGWKRRCSHGNGPGWDILAYRASEAGRVEIHGVELYRGHFESDHPDYHGGRTLFAPPPPPLPRRSKGPKYEEFMREYEEWSRKHREDEW